MPKNTNKTKKPGQTLVWQQIPKLENNQTWHHFFYQKILKYFNELQNQNFSVLWLKWTQTIEMKQSQTFFHGTCSNWHHICFHQKKLKCFNDFQNLNFPVLWLKWTQTMEMKQNQILMITVPEEKCPSFVFIP